MSGSDIPASGAATSVWQVGRKAGSGSSFSCPNFHLLLHVYGSPAVTGCPWLKCPSRAESCCSLFLMELRFTGSKVLAWLNTRPIAKADSSYQMNLSWAMLSPALFETNSFETTTTAFSSCFFSFSDIFSTLLDLSIPPLHFPKLSHFLWLRCTTVF